MKVFALPDLGEGLTEAEIVSWHAHVGDHVVSGQPLVSVETDKAVVEIPSPQSGRIAALHAEVGERVETGAPLVDFETGAEENTTPLVGELPTAPSQAAPARARPAPRRPPSKHIEAAPAVRAEARRRGIDLAAVTPTGGQGQVTLADLDRAAEAGPAEGYAPLSGARRSMAQAMARAHREVVPATVHERALVDHLTPDTDVTVRLVRAVAAGCLAEPALNAWLDGERIARRLNETVDVGIAVDAEAGLFVPVLRDAARLDAAAMRKAIDALKAGVLARTIAPADLKGATITLSNFGTIGGRYASLVVVPPQVAIVGAGRIGDEVVAVGGAPEVHRVLPLSLTFDHRAVTGGEAARFLAALIADIEKPQ